VRKEDELVARVVAWLDSRLGLSHPVLNPVPEYAVNPFYWIGSLAVVAFVIQGVTGMLMMLYYVPSPVQAFQSTQFIFQRVSYGRFLESVHLYTAYAMIMLAFMHMMHGYFVSAHKKPREMMWIVGMVMGCVTLGFGFTGYLLPWTVVSKSATDVGIGMIDALPSQISWLLSFLTVGAGGDAAELLRFYDLHVVVLPAVLLVLLTIKMYMLECHGISEPATGSGARGRLIPFFPDMSLYLMELAAIFGSAMLLISVIVPLNLPPQYSPQLAAQYTPQPDWYFLWIYQILKISVFEGPGLPVAMSLVTLLFILLFLLPFIDRSEKRRLADRPIFVTLGLIFVAELIALAYWGLITPGQIIPIEQAALVIGGTALIIALISYGAYWILFSRLTRQTSSAPKGTSTKSMTLFSFSGLTTGGAFAIGNTLNSTVNIITLGMDWSRVFMLLSSITLLAFVILATAILIYRIELPNGSLNRRARLLEKMLNESE
jgi:quinol-cytochrome oxidoreductase complex cytochrome b subunit